MSTAALVIEGVLRQPDAAIIPAGILMYHGLKEAHRLALISDSTADDPEVPQWLRNQGLVEHPLMVATRITEQGMSKVERRLNQVRRLRATGPIGVVILGDPEEAAGLLAEGIPVLLLATSRYVLPEWDPSKPLTPPSWAELVEEIDRQEQAFEDDERRRMDTL